ncbi:esterase [Occultella glacieicola]|uniref:Esterase n=1 Tax=Occultella glacieicola TaxID=2518684 RepID=A0ABY2E903_9MICO|nr:alpha/beta hydrolase-fold protein [Occultella glacieicola]TDE97260.1 esterase [Occultella glacieicola]
MREDPSTETSGNEVCFRLADPDARYRRVRLDADLGTTDSPRDLTRTDGVWELCIPRPPLGRVEYRFEVTTTLLDPANPHTAPGGFGDRSVLELPGYATPGWLAAEPIASRLADVSFTDTPVGDIDGTLWVPERLDPDEPAPLLIAHDGPDYAAMGHLTDFIGSRIDAGVLAPLRVLLLGSPDRMSWYAANDDYADALVLHVLDAARDQWPTTVMVAAGVSLGALAALHAQWRHPGAFDGLFLQSGSFFTPGTDAQESWFARFGDITSFVAEIAGATAEPGSVMLPVVTLTCGATEENVVNNRLMAAHLSRLGWDVRYAETDDLHNYVSWRDALEPHLTRLVTAAVGHKVAGGHDAT